MYFLGGRAGQQELLLPSCLLKFIQQTVPVTAFPFQVFAKQERHFQNLDDYTCDLQMLPFSGVKRISWILIQSVRELSGEILFKSFTDSSTPSSIHNALFSLVSELISWPRSSCLLTCQCDKTVSMTPASEKKSVKSKTTVGRNKKWADRQLIAENSSTEQTKKVFTL